MNRAAALARLGAGERFDLLVVGGGAVGLGAAVDAAARGRRVALIERGDFGGGTSSRSTKLIHGGVRYLRQGNFALVRESLRERARVLRNAPHLAAPLPFVIPCYRPGERWYYGAGLRLYDALAGRNNLSPSAVLDAGGVGGLLPGVCLEGLRGGVVYHDAQFDDARLALALARTAFDAGAAVVNYCAAVGWIRERGRIVGARFRDSETGGEGEIRAAVAINATGVFVDELRRWDEPGAPPLIALSQGVHLVVPARFLAGRAALMIPRTADRRVLFAVPWKDRLVLGTTDSPVSSPSAEPRGTPAEAAFILEHAGRYLETPPSATDVLSVFAGLRPLVRGSAPGARTASMSREHAIVVSPSGLVTVTGGKWTTYRQMAQDVVDRAERVAGWEHRSSPTARLRLHGGSQAGGGDAVPAHLAGYGSDAAPVAALARGEPGLADRLHPGLPLTGAEVIWHARAEMARTVEDVLARRSRCLLLDAAAAAETAPAVASLLARELGRDGPWQSAEAARFLKLSSGYRL